MQKLTKKSVDKVANYLRKKPRTGQDLLRLMGGEYLSHLRKVAEDETLLAKNCWTDHGWQFYYWIKPQRMGKNWKRTYANLNIDPDYGIEFGDF